MVRSSGSGHRTARIFGHHGGGILLLVVLSGTAGVRLSERADAYSDVEQSQRGRALMTPVAVEVDIFSGRPNPGWTLSEADATTFRSKLSGLQKTAARSLSANLGYRGLVITMPQETATKIHVQNGVVEVSGSTPSSFFLDPQRSLERWLVGTGREFLSSGILEAIDVDLKK